MHKNKNITQNYSLNIQKYVIHSFKYYCNGHKLHNAKRFTNDQSDEVL